MLMVAEKPGRMRIRGGIALKVRSLTVLMRKLCGELRKSPCDTNIIAVLILVLSSTCRKRLWNSEFQALPDNLEDAEKLQARRAKRTRCVCTVPDRSKQDM